jgi:hypothetical protein
MFIPLRWINRRVSAGKHVKVWEIRADHAVVSGGDPELDLNREYQKPWGSSGSCSLEHEPSTVRSMTCSPSCVRPCPPTIEFIPISTMLCL